MKLPKFLHERYIILLILFLLVAVGLSFWIYIYRTTFGFDMARDAYEAYSILYKHDIKIMGPGTDIVGLNHGVLWYYMLTVPYFIAHQDPQIAAIFFFLLAIITIPFVWKLSLSLFNDRVHAFVSVVLYAFSPLVIFLNSWLSNPVLCLYATPPLLLLIWSYIHKPTSIKTFLIGIFYGVLIQSQLANVLLLATIPLYIIFFRIKFRLKDAATLAMGLFISLSTYLLVEVKFHGKGVLGTLEFLKGHHGGMPNALNILHKLQEFMNLTVFPFENITTLLFAIIIIIELVILFKEYKKPLLFLLLWLINIILFTFFSTGVSTSSFVFIPSIAAGIILISFVMVKLLRKKFLIGIFLAVVVVFQIATVIKWQGQEFSPLAIPRSNTVYRYKQIVDYTYKAAEGKPFTIVTLTVPLYINTSWAYMYEFYGKSKYGYVPFWGGRGQTGFLGNLPEKQFGTDTRFLILESVIGIPDAYVAKVKYEEEKVSDIVEEKHFGYLTVQKRKLHVGKKDVPVPSVLKNSNVLYE